MPRSGAKVLQALRRASRMRDTRRENRRRRDHARSYIALRNYALIVRYVRKGCGSEPTVGPTLSTGDEVRPIGAGDPKPDAGGSCGRWSRYSGTSIGSMKRRCVGATAPERRWRIVLHCRTTCRYSHGNLSLSPRPMSSAPNPTDCGPLPAASTDTDASPAAAMSGLAQLMLPQYCGVTA